MFSERPPLVSIAPVPGSARHPPSTLSPFSRSVLRQAGPALLLVPRVCLVRAFSLQGRPAPPSGSRKNMLKSIINCLSEAG